MPRNLDYIPANNVAFNKWFKNLSAYVDAHGIGTGKVWDHIPPEAVAELAGEYNLWNAAYTLTLGPHTPGDTARRNAARTRAEGFARGFVKAYLKRPPVTDAQRVDMGIHVDSPGRTRWGKPAEFVELSVQPQGPGLVEIHFRIRGAEHRRRPPRTAGASLQWFAGETPPPEREGQGRRELMTSTPFLLVLKKSDRGKKLFLSARWRRGNVLGPRDETLETFVP